MRNAIATALVAVVIAAVLAGLDEEAIKAAKQWKFAPGTRNGEPVPVMVSIELTFTLGKD